MSGLKKPSIPSWQLQQQTPKSDDTQEEQSESSVAAADDKKPIDRQDLLDQASKFLEDESIRDATTDRKISFLESKGLSNDEIQKLLGVSRNPEAVDSSATTSTASSEVKNTSELSKDSNPSPSSSASPSNLSQTPSSAAAPSQPRANNVPPIITYPEFLYEAQKPPPLVSLSSVLYTIYAASGIAASIYGASEFLVKPMVASLTTARHDLAETTQHNLDTLNKKLEENVSTVPPAALTRTHPSSDDGKDEDSAESVTSDPTELFHRDIATQTTPDLETTPTSTATTEDDKEPSSAEKAVAKHLNRLQHMVSQLHEARTAETRVDSAYSEARDRVSELHTYLDSLTYSAPTYLNSSLYGMHNDNSSGDGKKSGISSGEEDAISAFRAEVRSVKGTLLSARNFPSGGAGYRFRSS